MPSRAIISAVLLTGSLILVSGPPFAAAHGGPEKVVDHKYVVSLMLLPAGDAARLRFFFRDFKTGRRLAERVFFRVRIRDEKSGDFLLASPLLSAQDGAGDWLGRFPRDGFYEVFLEFEKSGEPGKIYRPDDWYLWIAAGPGAGAGGAFAMLALSGLLAAGSGIAWRWHGKRNRAGAAHGAAAAKGLR